MMRWFGNGFRGRWRRWNQFEEFLVLKLKEEVFEFVDSAQFDQELVFGGAGDVGKGSGGCYIILVGGEGRRLYNVFLNFVFSVQFYFRVLERSLQLKQKSLFFKDFCEEGKVFLRYRTFCWQWCYGWQQILGVLFCLCLGGEWEDSSRYYISFGRRFRVFRTCLGRIR